MASRLTANSRPQRDQTYGERAGGFVPVGSAAIANSGPIDLGGGVSLIPAKTSSGYCLQAPLGYIGTGSATRPVVSEARPRCG